MGNRARPDTPLQQLRRPLRLTRMGLCAERALRAFWPLVSVVMLALATLMLGLHEYLIIEAVWTGAVLTVLGGAAALVYGLRHFRWPSRGEALARLDQTLPGRPIAALLDRQAIGATDPASAALWQAHQARMLARAQQAEAPAPDLRIAAADPFALRYLALLALVVGLLFGSIWRVATVTDMASGSQVAMTGPSWEGWIEPPRYTGLPTLYLNDLPGDRLDIPRGSRVTLRFYGQAGDLTLSETVSGRTGDIPSAADARQEFTVEQAGRLAIDGENGRDWAVTVVADEPPQVAVAGQVEVEADGTMALPFAASDDYGVVGGSVRIALDLLAVDRRHGLQAIPDRREDIVVDLPLPLSGDRSSFNEKLIEDFSKHPWANLPVTYTLSVRDAADQTGTAAGFGAPLAARRFFDPLAAAVIEQRRDLLWTRDNAPRVAQILRTLSHRPEKLFRDHGSYLRMRSILRRLESHVAAGLDTTAQDEIAEALWDLALQLEEGDVGDALERLRRARDRLSQAMRDGASDQEIAELMQELREASEDYMRQLRREAEANGEVMDENSLPENMTTLSQDDLQAMMDRIQELMEQGRMAEAEQALQELQQMMENMRMTNAPGSQSGGEGQQAMEDLAETLRNQQGLSDQAFRDLQEQYNPGARSGESDQNEGRNGGLGRGQSHEGGQGGEGQDGSAPDGAEGSGTGGSNSGSDPGANGLADRQQALRDELRRQQNGLPLGDTEAGQNARRSLEEAGRAMEGAEEALRQDDLAEAIDRQAEAMDALREGMRSLGEAMAEQQQGQAGNQAGRNAATQGNRMDPLGRDRPDGPNGVSDGSGIDDASAYRRAWDLLEEIRRRAGEAERSDGEKSYLKRLLDRF